MSVRAAPMPKKIRGADTGATVTDPNADPTGGTGIDFQGPQQDTNALALARILGTLQKQGPTTTTQHSTSSGSETAPPPVMAMLQEQGNRAQAMAKGYDPSATYLNGMEPGGLADIMSKFIGMVGGSGSPVLAEGNRRINRVPLDSLGTGLDDAIALANKVPTTTSKSDSTDSTSTSTPSGGGYDDKINALLGPLIDKYTNGDTKKNEAYNSNVFDTDYLRKYAPSLVGDNGTGENPYQKQESAKSAAAAKHDEDQARLDKMLGGGPDILGALGSGGSSLADFLGNLGNKASGALQPKVTGAQSSGSSAGPKAQKSNIHIDLTPDQQAAQRNATSQDQERKNEIQHQLALGMPGDDLLGQLADLVRTSGGSGANLLSSLSSLLQSNLNGASGSGLAPRTAPVGGGGGDWGPMYWNGITKRAEPSVAKRASGTGGDVHEGPTLLHVGERSHNDPNYESSEVVMAAPGTVVAPIPKGMKPTPENAMALVMAQLLKSKGKTEGSGPGVRGSADGSLTAENDSLGYLGQLGNFANIGSQYNLGTERNKNDATANAQNFQLGQEKNQNDARNVSQQGQNSWLQYLVGSGANANNWNKNQQDYTLGQENADLGNRSLTEKGREADMTNATNERQLDLQNVQQTFQRIMAGLSEASLPRFAGKTPATGLL